jgi:hypothetical protein
MFCPECQAEYRRGFTRCADCDVDLVGTLEEAVRHGHAQEVQETQEPKEAKETGSKNGLLWKGTDADFYLSLLTALDTFGIERMGRAVNPAFYEKLSDSLEIGFEKPEFGVWVTEATASLGRWILNSKLESETEEKEFLASGKCEGPTEEERAEAAQRTGYICPLCEAEYSEAVGECPNCGVPVRPAQGFSEYDGTVYYLHTLAHPQFQDALCEALLRAGIPFNNCRLINDSGKLTASNGMCVLDADRERVQRIFANLLARFEFGSGFLVRLRNDPTKDYWPVRAEKNRWFPEDLTAEVWSGTNLYKLVGIEQALQNFYIAYLVPVEEPGRAKILVHPEDEEQAREIVREVEEGPQLE